MPAFKPQRSFLDRLVSAGLRLLACAIAVYVAVRLVLDVAWPLFVLVGIFAVASGALAFLHYRNRGW